MVLSYFVSGKSFVWSSGNLSKIAGPARKKDFLTQLLDFVKVVVTTEDQGRKVM